MSDEATHGKRSIQSAQEAEKCSRKTGAEDDSTNSHGFSSRRNRRRRFTNDGLLMSWRKDETYQLCARRWRSGEWQVIERPLVGPERGISWLLLAADGRSWILDAHSKRSAFRAAKCRIRKELNWFDEVRFHLASVELIDLSSH